MNHTPGPWKAQRDLRGIRNNGPLPLGELSFGVYTDTRLLCMEDYRGLGFGPSDEEQEANAHLIAAAPDLLEALKPLAEWLYSFRISHKQVGNLDMSLVDNAVAAIAKAEGR